MANSYVPGDRRIRGSYIEEFEAERAALEAAFDAVESGIPAIGVQSFTSASAGAFTITLSKAISPTLLMLANALAVAGVPSPMFAITAGTPFVPVTGLAVLGSGGVNSVIVDITAVSAGTIAGTITANTLGGGETAKLNVVAVP